MGIQLSEIDEIITAGRIINEMVQSHQLIREGFSGPLGLFDYKIA
jgi:hypothetical protein